METLILNSLFYFSSRLVPISDKINKYLSIWKYGAVGPSHEWRTCWKILHGPKLCRLSWWEGNQLFIRGNFSFIAALFGLSGLIGVYFWRKGDQTTPEETLLGELVEYKKMKYEKNDRVTQEMFYEMR